MKFEVGQKYEFTTYDEKPLCGKVIAIENGVIYIRYPEKHRNIDMELEQIKQKYFLRKQDKRRR